MEEKSNKGLYIVIIFLVLLLLGVSGYLVYDKVLSNKAVEQPNSNENNKENNEKNIDNNNEINKEEVINDQIVLKNLRDAFNVLVISDQHDYNTLKDTLSYNYSVTSDFNINLFKKKSLDDLEKLETILRNIYKTKQYMINISKEKVSNQNFKNIYDDYKNSFNNIEEFSQINEKDVEDAYIKFYGVLPKHQDTKNVCPEFYYDSTNKVYFKSYECGGTGPEDLYTYINKVTKYNNAYNMYVSVGIGDRDTGKVYSNVNKNNIIDDIKNINNEYQQYKIDSSNYTNFSEYKLVFELDNNGNYIFKSIELIKD